MYKTKTPQYGKDKGTKDTYKATKVKTHKRTLK